MIKNKLFLQQKDHRYFLIPLSVTKLVNSYFNKEISEKTRGTVHFKKAVEFGNQFHKIAQKIIELKRINKFQQERFLYELQHQNYDYDLFKVVLVFID